MDMIGTIVTAAAVIIGAIWAYYRFVMDRTYRPRLNVMMEGEWLDAGGARTLLARVRVKNIGNAVVQLQQRGTGLRVRRLLV
jgi:hypothetical protein